MKTTATLEWLLLAGVARSALAATDHVLSCCAWRWSCRA